MKDNIVHFLRINNTQFSIFCLNYSCITNLSTHFSIKRRRVQHDGGFVFDADDFKNARGRFQFFKADKFRGRDTRVNFKKRNDFLFLRGAGASALLLH